MKIKKGSTRLVFVFKNIVIKIPNFTYSWYHFIQGILANINENKTWQYSNIKNSTTYQFKHLLCPVKYCSWGGWFLIMPTVNLLKEEDWENITDISEYKKYFGGDDVISNYGYLNNKLVKIDYN